jgi:hypothetical protein
MKLFAFAKYAAMAPALADQRGLVTFIGLCELAGAVGMILPALTLSRVGLRCRECDYR